MRATGITLSAQQRDFTVARAADRGLTDSVEVRLQDYRDFGNLASAAAFDAVDSIEMGEHVGEQLYPAYVRILSLESRFDEFLALQGEQVARVWRLYLAGGRLAFEEGRMGVDQVLAAKPAAPGR